MPLDDFLIGAALFGAMLATVALATALIVRRRLRHLDKLELGLAGVVVGTAVLIGVHLVPLMLGVLARAEDGVEDLGGSHESHIAPETDPLHRANGAT